nr:hypothetical protein [Kofleriaceae bacterium]
MRSGARFLVAAGLALVAFAVPACDAIFGLHQRSGGGGSGDGGIDGPVVPPSSWQTVSTSALHSCGIHVDGTLWCWGRNDNGELGVGSATLEADTPTKVGDDVWTAVAAGAEHTCAIRSDATLWCWGSNLVSQTGAPAGGQVFEPTQVGSGTWTAVTAGAAHTCAIAHDDMSLWCWGDDVNGQVGDNRAGTGSVTPVMVTSVPPAPDTWLAVSAGNLFTCGIRSDHSLWCWGDNSFSELASPGAPQTNGVPLPSAGSGATWQAITTGDYFACAIQTDGHARCFGRASEGQLGNDTTSDGDPSPVSHDDATWSAIAAAGVHACGVHASDQSLWCWGGNSDGELALDTGPDRFRSLPQQVVAPATTWTAVVAGDSDTCAIDASHQLWCAGLDGGELGEAGGGARTRPVMIGSNVASVAIGGDVLSFPPASAPSTTCAISTAHALTCWGFNGTARVGDGTQFDRDVPTAIDGSATWQTVAIGDHACATGVDKVASCWGNSDAQGQLGAGAIDLSELSPTQITGTFTTITASQHSCALDPAGNVWCWGDDSVGQCGAPATPQPIVTPTQIQGVQPMFSALATGYQFSCAIDISHAVECWGDNTFGKLGNPGAATSVPTVVQMPAGTYTGVTVGAEHACAGDGTGSWYCWGDNADGQLGNQTVNNSSSGVPVDGSWLQLAAGDVHTCGVKTDHSLACWGNNAFGQLGDGSLIERHEPTAVGSDTDWLAVATGLYTTCAVKLNNDLYCWGRDLNGEVGDGTAWRSALVVVP